MNLRDFLRGGYKDLQEPVTLTWHGRPAFFVTPYSTPTVTGSQVTASTPPQAGNTYTYAGPTFAASTTLPQWLTGKKEDSDVKP